MISNRPKAPDALQIKLAHTLGFPNYPNDATAEPYLNYITNRHVGRDTLEGYITLLVRVIEACGRTRATQSPGPTSIQSMLDSFASSTNDDYFADTKAGSQTRWDDVEDTVMYAIGTWTMMLSSFIHLSIAGGVRKVTLAYTLRTQDGPSGYNYHPYEVSLSSLMKGSGLLPRPGQYLPFEGTRHGSGTSVSSIRGSCRLSLDNQQQSHMSLKFLDDLDSLESLSVSAKRLNAYTLKFFGAVDISWTQNISRHLLLSRRCGRYILEVFAMPCALKATSLTSGITGISPELAQEVMESYALLFNPWSDTPQHANIGRMFGLVRFCWCWSCSAQRFRRRAITKYKRFSKHRSPATQRHNERRESEYDPLLIELMRNEPSDWTPDLFPNLWSRVILLEDHLQGAKPWSIWVLFRDRRDTLQFWTFL